MKPITKDIEQKLNKHISDLNEKGYNIPMSVGKISGFPYKSFKELKIALEKRDAVLLRFSFSYMADVAKNLNPSMMWNINLIITCILPLASIGLAIFVSWWFIIGLLFFFVGLSRGKKLHNETMFNASMTNELAFCFLFYAGQISVKVKDEDGQYYYDRENNNTKHA